MTDASAESHGEPPGPAPAPITPPGVSLTLTEAASACRVHRATVRRKLDAHAFPNAWRDADGVWRIPVGDLRAAGLPVSSWGNAEPVARAIPEQAEQLDDVARLLAENMELRRRAEVAEAVAQERERTIGLLEQALRALPPGVPLVSHAIVQPEQPPVSRDSPPPRRRWWQRAT